MMRTSLAGRTAGGLGSGRPGGGLQPRQSRDTFSAASFVARARRRARLGTAGPMAGGSRCPTLVARPGGGQRCIVSMRDQISA